MDTRFRELEEDENHGWSDWIWAMVPNVTNVAVVKRENRHLGYRNADLSTELEQEFEGGCAPCGIYEFAATLPGKRKRRVVYVGSTCVRNGSCPSLKNRIVDYTKHGNHKKDEINEALRRGYTLWVRFKPAQDKPEAKKMENDLLSEYNYAWNVRNNGVRPILASAKEWEWKHWVSFYSSDVKGICWQRMCNLIYAAFNHYQLLHDISSCS